MTPTSRQRGAAKHGLIVLIVFALILAAGYGLFRLGSYIDRSDLRRQGPAVLVVDETPQLWVMVKLEEHASVRGMGRQGTRYQLELHSHDVRNGQRAWERRLRAVGSNEGGHGAQGRILGQDGKVVWLFVHDGPVAVSVTDGSVIATREQIEQRNPELRTLIPTELDYYTFDSGLVFIAADARRFRVTAPTWVATPYLVADEQKFSSMKFMTTRWNGGWETKEFQTPHIAAGARWQALYTEKEAAEAGNDTRGDRLKDPKSALGSDPLSRRAMWSAKPRATKDQWGETFERLFDVERIPGVPEFLHGGFLLDQGKKTPLYLDPYTGVVLHRTRVDAQGRLALTPLTINDGARTGWTAALPFADLHSRWQWPSNQPDRLLLMGHAEELERGITRFVEYIVFVDLGSGRVQGWNLTDGAPWSPK